MSTTNPDYIAHLQNLRRTHLWWRDFFSPAEGRRLLAATKVDRDTTDFTVAEGAFGVIQRVVEGVEQFINDVQDVAQQLAETVKQWERHFDKRNKKQLLAALEGDNLEQMLAAIGTVRAALNSSSRQEAATPPPPVAEVAVRACPTFELLPNERAPKWLVAARAS
jgi:hypothetical protein